MLLVDDYNQLPLTKGALDLLIQGAMISAPPLRAALRHVYFMRAIFSNAAMFVNTGTRCPSLLKLPVPVDENHF